MITGSYNEKGYRVRLRGKLVIQHGNDRDHATDEVASHGGRRIPVTLLKRYCETAMRLLSEKENVPAREPLYVNTL